MGKIILKNKLTNETIELEGNIQTVPDNWEIMKDKVTTIKKNANGDGSFYFSDTLQKWIGQIQPPNGGKRITVTQRKNETKTECKKRYENIKAKINNGTYIEKSKDTLYAIIKRHIDQKHKDGILSSSSHQRNLETLEQLNKTCKNFIHKSIQKVTIEDIEDAKEEIKKYGTSCIDKQWQLLRTGFKVAYSRRKIQFNIMDDITLSKPISCKVFKPREALTILEEKRLREILNNEEKDHKYRDIVMMQLETGMRIGEVLARTLDDVNFKENTFHIWNTLIKDGSYKIEIGEHTKIYNKKTRIDKGERTIPLSTEVLKIITKLQNNSIRNIHNLLFWDYSKNTFVSGSEINSWLYRINVKYKISNKNFSTHTLRHTRITRLQEAGISLPVIQSLVGHVEGSKITNDVYTSVSLDFINNELMKIKGDK